MLCQRSGLLTITFLLVATVALGAPSRMLQQGRLLDDAGSPMEGTHTLGFTLYDAETAGAILWSENQSYELDAGYYAVTLGSSQPLDGQVFTGSSLWLEVAVDGVILSPRQEIVSVPYALQAESAGRLEGGLVDATEVLVGGTVIIDSSGAWVGPTISVDWSDLVGVPADLTDGDQDEDSLAALNCASGEIARYDSQWICSTDLDTQLTEAGVDTFVANNNYSTGPHTTDTNTQLSESEVDAFVANNGYSTGAHTVDTNTQLTNAQVAAAALAEGFATGPHTVNTDTQLTNAQVAAAALAEGFATGPHTVNTDTQLTNAQVAAAALAEGFATGPHTTTLSAADTSAGQFGDNVGGGNFSFPSEVGIGTQASGYKLDVASGGAMTARFGSTSADKVIIGGGAGEIDVGTVDPVYTISGQRYATYLPAMTGVQEETHGLAELSPRGRTGSLFHVIDFDEVERASDLWLFFQTTDLGEDWENLTVLLTPSFNGRVWYEKQPSSNRLILYGDQEGEVSFRLTARRFDHREWPNKREGEGAGFVFEEK